MANLLVEKVERFHLLGHMLQVGPGVALDAEEKGKFETMISEQTCFQKVISSQAGTWARPRYLPCLPPSSWALLAVALHLQPRSRARQAAARAQVSL